jgi:hypothetical protein
MATDFQPPRLTLCHRRRRDDFSQVQVDNQYVHAA